MTVNQSLLPFKITLESLEPFEKDVDGYNFSHVGMRIHLQRNNLGLLLGGFYAPMGLFSALSLISYTIDPDIVSYL